MVNSTLERPIAAIQVTAPEQHSPTRCRICSEFGSEECDVLDDLGRYRQTEEATQEAAERHAARFSPRESPVPRVSGPASQVDPDPSDD
jgi:hypothetical protein